MLSNILRLKEAPYNKFDLLDEFILGDTGRELDQLMVDQLGEDYTIFYQGDSISMSESSSIITQGKRFVFTFLVLIFLKKQFCFKYRFRDCRFVGTEAFIEVRAEKQAEER